MNTLCFHPLDWFVFKESANASFQLSQPLRPVLVSFDKLLSKFLLEFRGISSVFCICTENATFVLEDYESRTLQKASVKRLVAVWEFWAWNKAPCRGVARAQNRIHVFFKDDPPEGREIRSLLPIFDFREK